MVALLEKLLADGALHSYSIDEETVHSRNPDWFTVAIIANGAPSTSSTRQSTRMKRRTPQDGPDLARWVDNEGHRDFLARVDSMANK